MLASLVPERLMKSTKLPYIIILFLLFAIAYSLQRQTTSSVDEKTIEAGLIEAGNRPALYFTLMNIENEQNSYTFIVDYNSPDGEPKVSTDTIYIDPGYSFRYSLILERPLESTMAINLKIFKGEADNNENILHDQKWFIRP